MLFFCLLVLWHGDGVSVLTQAVIAFHMLFFGLECPLQDLSLLSSFLQHSAAEDRRQASLINEILLDKIWLTYYLLSEVVPNITLDSGTITF